MSWAKWSKRCIHEVILIRFISYEKWQHVCFFRQLFRFIASPLQCLIQRVFLQGAVDDCSLVITIVILVSAVILSLSWIFIVRCWWLWRVFISFGSLIPKSWRKPIHSRRQWRLSVINRCSKISFSYWKNSWLFISDCVSSSWCCNRIPSKNTTGCIIYCCSESWYSTTWKPTSCCSCHRWAYRCKRLRSLILRIRKRKFSRDNMILIICSLNAWKI